MIIWPVFFAAIFHIVESVVWLGFKYFSWIARFFLFDCTFLKSPITLLNYSSEDLIDIQPFAFSSSYCFFNLPKANLFSGSIQFELCRSSALLIYLLWSTTELRRYFVSITGPVGEFLKFLAFETYQSGSPWLEALHYNRLQLEIVYREKHSANILPIV